MTDTLTVGADEIEPLGPNAFTIAYDLHVQQLLESTGLGDLLAEIPRTTDTEKREALARAVIQQLATSGKAGTLAACFVQPVGEDWTPSWAVSAGSRFERLTDPGGRQILLEILVTGLQRFFLSGGRSYETSPASSAAEPSSK